ncbi:MAG: alkanesulfonate-binding protein [Akkermansiaceae bacterium]|nr:alkanesulfonate-binding protein [Akkermansiaceae bacterium]
MKPTIARSAASTTGPVVRRTTFVVFEDPRSKALIQHLKLVSPSDANVLIVGETGTGKEIIARHIHDHSKRAAQPFVAVNCGAFSETLIESELFGHERGAFTGASSAKAGWFETASGGTLFLDEIGELPLPLQVKLLRVLQERQVVRLGSRTSIPIDVRFIAATNVQLEEAVTAGRFREDLYYRLKVATFELAPLRDRPGDILPLARHFLQIYAERLGMKDAAFRPDAEQALVTGHTWPGNIRELENVVHHALLVSKANLVLPENLNLAALRPLHQNSSVEHGTARHSAREKLREALVALFEEGAEDLHAHIENAVMRTAYEYCHRNQVQTAKLLGISRNIVRARLVQCSELAAKPRAVKDEGASLQTVE